MPPWVTCLLLPNNATSALGQDHSTMGSLDDSTLGSLSTPSALGQSMECDNDTVKTGNTAEDQELLAQDPNDPQSPSPSTPNSPTPDQASQHNSIPFPVSARNVVPFWSPVHCMLLSNQLPNKSNSDSNASWSKPVPLSVSGHYEKHKVNSKQTPIEATTIHGEYASPFVVAPSATNDS